MVDELIRQGQVTLLDRPELYIYTYHGDEYVGRTTIGNEILRRSQPLRDG